MSTKYLRLDLEAIRRDFPQVWAQYGDLFEITPRIGFNTDYPPCDRGQFILGGDVSFHFLLTKK